MASRYLKKYGAASAKKLAWSHGPNQPEAPKAGWGQHPEPANSAGPKGTTAGACIHFFLRNARAPVGTKTQALSHKTCARLRNAVCTKKLYGSTARITLGHARNGRGTNPMLAACQSLERPRHATRGNFFAERWGASLHDA